MPIKKSKLPVYRIENYKEKLNKLSSLLFAPNQKKYDAIFQGLHELLAELRVDAFQTFARTTKLNQHKGLIDNNPQQIISASITLEEALYSDILLLYAVLLERKGTFNQSEQVLPEVEAILNDTVNLDLTIETYRLYMMILGELSLDDPCRLYQSIHALFESAHRVILKEKNCSPFKDPIFEDEEQNNYTSIALQTFKTLPYLEENEHKYVRMISYIEKMVATNLLFPAGVYFSILQQISQTPLPNLKYTFWCFKGLQQHQFDTSLMFTNANEPLSFVEKTLISNIMSILDSRLSFSVDSMHILESCFVHMFYAIHKNLAAMGNNKFKKDELNGFIKMFDVAQAHNASRAGWKVILNMLWSHKKILTEAHQKVIYNYCHSYSLDEIGDNLPSFLNIISSFSSPDLSEVKRISLLISGVEGADFILKSLENTKDFSVDFEFLFKRVTVTALENNKTFSTKKIFSNLVKIFNESATDLSKRQELFVFFQRHISLIKESKVTFNRFLRAGYNYSLDFPGQDIEALIHDEEYLAYDALMQLSNNVITHLPYDSSPRFKRVLLLLIEQVESILFDAIYLPSEKKTHLATIVEKLQYLNARARLNYMSIDAYYSGFIRLLNGPQDENLFANIYVLIEKCQEKLQETEARQEEAVDKLKDSISKDSVFREQDVGYYIKKIRKHISERQYDDASILIALTKQTFPGRQEKTLLYCFASCAIGYEQYPTALAIYEKIFATERNVSDQLIKDIAYCHRKIATPSHLQKAILLYNQLLKNCTDEKQRVNLLYNKLTCLIQAGRLAEAENVLESIPIVNMSANFMSLKGRIFYLKKDVDNAILWHEKAFVSTPQPSNNQSEKLARVSKPIITRDSYNAFCSNVLSLFRMRKYHEALELLEVRQSTHGNDSFIYRKIAECHIFLSKPGLAIEQLLAFPDYKKNIKMLRTLALAYQKAKLSERALDVYDDLITTFSTHPHVYTSAIKYCVSIKNKNKAEHYWKLFLAECTEYERHALFIQKIINNHFPDIAQLPDRSVNQELYTTDLELDDGLDVEEEFIDVHEPQVIFEPSLELIAFDEQLSRESVVLDASLPSEIIELLCRILTISKELYIVGSAVHSLINKTPLSSFQDVDITIITDKAEMLVDQLGFQKSSYILGLYTSKIGDIRIDCVVASVNGKSDLIDNDFLSRDFTMNCLYCDMNGRIYDPTNKGIEHFNNKTLETVHESAQSSFDADPVRIIRAVKYMATGYSPTENVLSGLLQKNQVETSMKGHVNAVTRKCLYFFKNQGRAHEFVAELKKYNLLSELFNLNADDSLPIENILEQLNLSLYPQHAMSFFSSQPMAHISEKNQLCMPRG